VSVSDDHLSLPVRLPDFSHLSNEELRALRSKIGSVTRDARKKAQSAIQKYPAVRQSWMQVMGQKRDPDHEEAYRTLERELLRYPEAFLAEAYVNSLFVLDEAIRAEMLKRSFNGTAIPKKKSKTEPPPTPEPVEPSNKPLWELVGSDDDASSR